MSIFSSAKKLKQSETEQVEGSNTIAPRNGFFIYEILVLFLYHTMMSIDRSCSIDIFTVSTQPGSNCHKRYQLQYIPCSSRDL